MSIEVVGTEQYRNLAQVVERHGRRAVNLVIRTDLEGKALEVFIAEALNATTVIEFQISEIAKHQPWKVQVRHEQMQPRREVITVNGKAIARAVEKKRAAAGDVEVPQG